MRLKVKEFYKTVTLTDTFIKGLSAKSENIPGPVLKQARKVLLDYLGVLAGGKKYLTLKRPELVEAEGDSAFLNGFAAHVLELDDGHRHGNGVKQPGGQDRRG